MSLEFKWSSTYYIIYVRVFQDLLSSSVSLRFSAQTVSLIWHVPYIDRVVIDRKEREFHRICYQQINEDENSAISILNGESTDGISDFDLNAYLNEHIPVPNQIPNEENPDRIGAMIGKMNETDRRILNLMDYYEKP